MRLKNLELNHRSWQRSLKFVIAACFSCAAVFASQMSCKAAFASRSSGKVPLLSSSFWQCEGCLTKASISVNDWMALALPASGGESLAQAMVAVARAVNAIINFVRSKFMVLLWPKKLWDHVYGLWFLALFHLYEYPPNEGVVALVKQLIKYVINS